MPISRSTTYYNGVSGDKGQSKSDIALDQYNQLGDVRNVHTGDGNFDNHYESTRFVDREHERWKLKPDAERFSEHLAGNAKDLVASRLGGIGGKRRYTYHKKSKRSHSKTGGRRRKHSTTKKHRRGRK